MEYNLIIFGAGGGIGKSLIYDACNWATNIFTASRDEQSDIWNDNWGDFPSKISHLSCDLTQSENIVKVFNEAQQKFGRIDGIINTVGGSLYMHSIEEFPIEEFDKVISLNLRTAFIITQESIRHMKDNDLGGNLVHIVSSSAKKIQSTDKAPYGIAKAAVARLIQYAATEAADCNIRINGVTPSSVFTERDKKEVEKKLNKGDDRELVEKHIFRRQLIKKQLNPDDILPVIKLLSKTQVITGQIYNVTLGEVISY